MQRKILIRRIGNALNAAEHVHGVSVAFAGAHAVYACGIQRLFTNPHRLHPLTFWGIGIELDMHAVELDHPSAKTLNGLFGKNVVKLLLQPILDLCPGGLCDAHGAVHGKHVKQVPGGDRNIARVVRSRTGRAEAESVAQHQIHLGHAPAQGIGNQGINGILNHKVAVKRNLGVANYFINRP